MPERPLRRRVAGATATLLAVGMIFAPAATSQGNPHGTPPGQVGKGAKNPPSGTSVASSPPSATHVPPGQAKKQAPVAPSPASAPASGVSAKAVQAPASVAKGNPNAPGQIKKAAANATSTASTVPAGQAKKQARAVTATPAPTPTPTPAVSANTASATPSPPAPTTTPAKPSPAKRRAAKHPTARRSAAQRRSSHQRASARQLATARRTAARARATARARSPLATAGTVAAAGAAVAGAKTQHSNTRAGNQAVANPTGHGQNAGPVSNLISNLIPVPLPVPDWSKPIILALVLICGLLGIRAWLTSRRAHRLETQRRRLAADLESLQPALVPEIPASFGPLAVSVAYRPADGPAAGGDFYDVFAVGSGRVAMMVGDVSGHGRDALARAAHMRYMLRAYMETGLDPRSALKLAGRVLGADDDALFTTVAVAVYDRSASTMTYATAGHPPPIMLGPAAHRPLSIASPALGWGEPTGRRQTTIPFAEGARACFFSDGVTELRIRDGLLGREELTDEVERSGSASELLERVQRRARIIRDDMASCMVEARAGTAISEIRTDEFEVEMRHLDAGQGQRFLTECGVSVENANSTLAHARLIAAESGSALLRVEMTEDSAAASAGGSAPVSLATPPNLAPAGSWDSETSALR